MLMLIDVAFAMLLDAADIFAMPIFFSRRRCFRHDFRYASLRFRRFSF